MLKTSLCTLQFSSTSNYKDNLHTLVKLINETPEQSIVLAPEVCLTDFDYKNFEEAANFSKEALEELLPLSQEKVLILTVIEKRDDGKFFNVAKVLHKGSLVHEQCKNKLFRLSNEDMYFTQGKDEKLSIFEINGIKFGLLICFELRFKSYWQDLEGAHVILVPSRWGKLRSENYEVLTQALAVMNQCYVLASDASNTDCSGRSGIISPFGETTRNGNALCLIKQYNKQELRKMRRYLDVGIK